jgi:polar amino acid transport system ATP-binding protein
MIRIAAQGVWKEYDGRRVLDDVAFESVGGRIACLLGPSGSGKSTLLRILMGLEPADAGRVRIEGLPEDPLAIRRATGLVQQTPGLLRTTAWRNVAFQLRARGLSATEARQAAHDWLERLGVADRAEALPHELSGGQTQRVALARALAAKPTLLFVDEGTNQLDARAVLHVESLLRYEASRGCAVVLVTHNVSQATRIADSFVYLDGGRVVEAGPGQGLRSPSTDSLRLAAEAGM